MQNNRRISSLGLVILIILLSLICSILSSDTQKISNKNNNSNNNNQDNNNNNNKNDDSNDTDDNNDDLISSPTSTATTTLSPSNKGRKRQQHHHHHHNNKNPHRGKNHHHGFGMRSRHGKSQSMLNQYNLTVNSNPPFPPTSDSFWRKEISIPLPNLDDDEDDDDDDEDDEDVLAPRIKANNARLKKISEGDSPSSPPPSTTTTKSHRPRGNSFSKKEKDNSDSMSGGSKNRGGSVVDTRPNIILIITDDQDVELGSMDFMPETLKVFKDEGIEFRHGYVTTPMCCPSRSSLLTGLYVHNHQVFTNNDNCSSIAWRSKYEKKTFAHYLHTSGYYTSYIGKYLNKYDGSHQPSGWDEWNALLMNSRFYNYTVNRNGRKVRYGNNYETDYYPDVITNDTLDFLDRMAQVNPDVPRKPFLLVVSFPSPHGPEDSHPKFSELFFNATPHHTPSYNYAPNSDKQWILRLTEKMTPQLMDFTNLLMTKRLQTLQSVDVAVQSMFRKLESSGLINSTYTFYTSDHGYHVGQFGLVKGKSMPYEFDIRVPFYLSMPKEIFNRSATIQEPVLNIDLAPTFLELAGVPVPPHMENVV